MTIGLGILTGNVLGFVRVALIAYFLGTHSRADSLAVAMGPVDALNSVLINSMIFAFVPLLAAAAGVERAVLFRKLCRCFTWAFLALTLAMVAGAPWLMRVLAPGLDARYFEISVTLFRILSVSSLAAGVAAVKCALLYTSRRFAPTAFYQAALNMFTIAGALCLWRVAGVYGFAIGYTAGAWAQLAIVHFASRSGLEAAGEAECGVSYRELLAKPAFFLVYATGMALNVTFTRAYATHSGSGMAAALDYCMRGVSVPLAILVGPMSSSLLPEIARLRSINRLPAAFRLIDRTIKLAGFAALAGCGFALLFRQPAIALLFQRGNFTAESTSLVSTVFLALGPSLVGWSLMEITARSLFGLNRPWPPVVAGIVPLVVNVALTLSLPQTAPQFVGLGASVGFVAGFAVLTATARTRRNRWLAEG